MQLPAAFIQVKLFQFFRDSELTSVPLGVCWKGFDSERATTKWIEAKQAEMAGECVVRLAVGCLMLDDSTCFELYDFAILACLSFQIGNWDGYYCLRGPCAPFFG